MLLFSNLSISFSIQYKLNQRKAAFHHWISLDTTKLFQKHCSTFIFPATSCITICWFDTTDVKQ